MQELQGLLKPFDGELDVYPVSKEVGKVGNNSPSFIIPVDSKENKNNIANFFSRGGAAAETKSGTAVATTSPQKANKPIKSEEDAEPGTHQPDITIKRDEGFVAAEDGGAEDDRESKSDIAGGAQSHKRKAEGEEGETREMRDSSPPTKKKPAVAAPPSSSPTKTGRDRDGDGRGTISSTRNSRSQSHGQSKDRGKKPSQDRGAQRKITGFFANSS